MMLCLLKTKRLITKACTHPALNTVGLLANSVIIIIYSFGHFWMMARI